MMKIRHYRGCPGRHFAQDTLWITIASILSVFTISNAIDEGGQPIVPHLKYTADLVRFVIFNKGFSFAYKLQYIGTYCRSNVPFNRGRTTLES